MKLVMVHMCRITQAAQTGRGDFISCKHTEGEEKKKRTEEAGHAPVSSGGNKSLKNKKK